MGTSGSVGINLKNFYCINTKKLKMFYIFKNANK